MSILERLAICFDKAAHSIREIEKRRTMTGSSLSTALHSVLPAADAYPLGFWRCTVSSDSIFSQFKVGQFYHCSPDAAGVPRIYPKRGSSWAPYWVFGQDRFCYSTSEIDFEFVGASLPADALCEIGRTAKAA